MTISTKNCKIPLYSTGGASRDVPEVNLIFGKNLRKLCATRPSISAVSQDLDIGRVQFGRLLTGHSFPKPFVLERICAYFGVDARILLEPMDDFLIERMARSRAMAAHPGGNGGLMKSASPMRLPLPPRAIPHRRQPPHSGMGFMKSGGCLP